MFRFRLSAKHTVPRMLWKTQVSSLNWFLIWKNMVHYVLNWEALNSMDNKCELMRKLQAYNFAAYDMLLFLDTHPDDKQAFSIFKDLVTNTKKIKRNMKEIMVHFHLSLLLCMIHSNGSTPPGHGKRRQINNV